MDCIDIIQNTLGRPLDDDEVTELVEQARKLKKKLQATTNAADLQDKLRELARQRAEHEKIAAIAKKRALHLQKATRLKAVDFCLTTFTGKEADGITALQVGVQSAREMSRLSVDAIGKGLTGSYVGGFLNDLRTLGKQHYTLFKRGAMDRDIAIALYTLDNPNAPRFTGPKEAMDIAQVMHKWQERARVDCNKAGAWIGKEPGYIIRQSHNRTRVGTAGFEKWKADVLPHLDWKRTAGGIFDPTSATDMKEIDKYLKVVFDDIVTGVYLKNDYQAPTLAKTGTIGSTAARVSEERILHFKTGEEWFDYHTKYGTGNMREAFLYGVERVAQSTALMRVFGPSPQANLDSIVKDIRVALRNKGDTDGLTHFDKARNRLSNQMKEIDGTLNIAGNPTLAAVGRGVRAIMTMSKLGGALISSWSDAVTFASEFAYQGRGFWGPMLNALRGLAHGRGTKEQQRILAMCGVFFETMSNGVASRFSGDDLPGKLTGMQNLFFRMNGLSWWTDTFKLSATLMLSHDLALEKGLGWEALSSERQCVLGLYGIDEGRWDMLRKVKMLADDGREYMTPEAIYSVPDDDIGNYLIAQGRKNPSKTQIANLRDEVAEQLRTYFRDRTDYAVLEPDARSRAIVRQGQAAGTVTGELLRFIMQFKSFPTAFLQKTLGREFYGRGAESFGEALRNRHGEMSNFARLFIMMTAFGFLSMTAKQLLAGKTPRDPTDPKTWLAAAVQGGGAGIYGDFLFGERSRMGSSFYSSLAGPAFGSAESVYNLYNSIKEGKDVRTEAFRLFFNHIPGNNLYWFRWAFDYAIGWNLYEMMNPGYIARMKRKVKKENNQTFWREPLRW